jgi:serine/threonine protein kinase
MSVPEPSAPPARRLEPHNRVAGKYRLRRRLAVGGMGEIWVAKNEATGADVALKVLRPDADKSLQAEERFRHEAKISAMLSHRSIVRIYDLVEETDSTLVLVMELLRGETLQAYLERKGPRPAREAIAIIAPILSALQHAHEAGVIHRDVTPSNIYLSLDPDGQVTPKLVDFGIAKSAANPIQTIDGRVLGTPRYMSPEQIRSGASAELDGRTDIFGVGVILYEILTGASPFAASSASASLAKVLEAHVDPDTRIDPKVWVEIQRAISKRPYERHTNALELASMLRAAIGETEHALSASLQRTRPPPRLDDADLPPHVPDPVHETRSIEGQSMVLTLPTRKLTWLWIGGGVALGIALAIGAAAVRGASRASAAGDVAPAAPSATAVASTVATSTSIPTSIASTTSVVPSPTVASAPATAPLPKVAPKKPAGPRAKPIATTPGF